MKLTTNLTVFFSLVICAFIEYKNIDVLSWNTLKFLIPMIVMHSFILGLFRHRINSFGEKYLKLR
ncbi:MAG: hypothetical protein PHX25_01055 [Candidatus Pacebacteria bacterium]|nr:hypothetical protein [Candidatus Paceibacterota bacterium]